MLGDRHRDENGDAKPAIFQFSDFRNSVLLPVHELGEVIRVLPLETFEGKVYFSRRGKNIAKSVVLAK